MRPSKCAAHASPATDDLRAKALTSSRVRFLRARRLVGSQEAAARLLGASVDSIQLWERGKARIPAWALVLVEELTHGGPHASQPAPVVAVARAKHLPVRLNETAHPAVESAEAQPGHLSGQRSVEIRDAHSGSTPTLAAPRSLCGEPSIAQTALPNGEPEGSGPAEPRAGQLVDSPRESANYFGQPAAAPGHDGEQDDPAIAKIAAGCSKGHEGRAA